MPDDKHSIKGDLSSGLWCDVCGVMVDMYVTLHHYDSTVTNICNTCVDKAYKELNPTESVAYESFS